MAHVFFAPAFGRDSLNSDYRKREIVRQKLMRPAAPSSRLSSTRQPRAAVATWLELDKHTESLHTKLFRATMRATSRFRYLEAL